MLSNEAAYLYKVWLKYLQPDERYGLDTKKINKGCNSVKMEPELTRVLVLVFCNSFDVTSSLYMYQVS